MLLVGWASSFCQADERPPNVLILLCDDLGYGDLGCYGHPVIETPHLDRLARQGWRLTDCYSAAPVCSPARAGLLTGISPSRLGVYDWIPPGHAMHLRTRHPSIATRLKTAGYQTCHVGKWHLNGLFNQAGQPQPHDHGFDHWYATQNNAAPSHRNPTNFVRNGEPVGPQVGYSCQLVADEAIAWLESRNADAPFFQWICFHEPHEPIASPPEAVRAIRDRAGSDDEAEYFANVMSMDAAVGRILAAVDRLGLTETTLVVFTSDNGPETHLRYPGARRSFGRPGDLRGMKLHVTEGGIRVPGIIRFPGRTTPGQTITTPISALDLMPTVCDLAGIEPPSAMTLDGVSLVPLFGGEPLVRTRPLFWYYGRALGDFQLAVRAGRYSGLGRVDGVASGPGRPYTPGDVDRLRAATATAGPMFDLETDRSQRQPLTEEAAVDDGVRESLRDAMIERFRDVQASAVAWESAP